jgi:hypothetical protein
MTTLNQFYYKKMIGSAPKNFAEMVVMGVQLEEGVREGRLIMESVLASSSNTFGNNFPRKNEQEVSMVAQGRPQQKYSAYQHIDAVTPATIASQQPGCQPQYPQQPYHQQQPRQQASRAQFAPIPVKYEVLLQLLERNLVQTKAPPPVSTRLPAWYIPDLFCTFHQGAPSHDIEHCNAMK